ncbi:MAG: hypothetical protein KDD22_02890, partial [Bdellovibrionales bacterium]|nr:hypothetical protein [Bdellovibrionales bacterium]
MQNQFIVSHNGVEIGPLSANDILNKLSTGEFDPIDYVYMEEAQDWIMLDEFKLKNTQNNPKKEEQPPKLQTPYPNVDEKAAFLFVEPPKKKEEEKPPVLINGQANKLQQDDEPVPLEASKPTKNTEPLLNAKRIGNPKSVKLKDGQGVASLSALKVGEIWVELKSKTPISNVGKLKIQINSG